MTSFDYFEEEQEALPAALDAEIVVDAYGGWGG